MSADDPNTREGYKQGFNSPSDPAENGTQEGLSLRERRRRGLSRQGSGETTPSQGNGSPPEDRKDPVRLGQEEVGAETEAPHAGTQQAPPEDHPAPEQDGASGACTDEVGQAATSPPSPEQAPAQMEAHSEAPPTVETYPNPDTQNSNGAVESPGKTGGAQEDSVDETIAYRQEPEPVVAQGGPSRSRARAKGWAGKLKSGLKALRDAAGEGRLPRPDREGGEKLSPQELEKRLKLSLRESSVGVTMRVCVGSPKGGVGKSSIAYALAGSIGYYTNMRVALVDADPNFGSTRLLVPRPIEASVVDMANDADALDSLSKLRDYVSQNEKLRLDTILGPKEAHQMAAVGDLEDAYSRIDSVLSKFYDLVIYDLGLGFRDPAIRHVLSLSNELLFVTDSEVIPNAMLSDAIRYVEKLGVDLRRTTLVMNHRLPPAHESAATPEVRSAHANLLRRMTEIPYDSSMSQLLNTRSFHIEDLSQQTRLGILTTAAACLEGLRDVAREGGKVID